ncbi:TonB-dependent receptor [Rhodocyclus tenuis]|uniref:TonB-dependent receptor n=2 Tax=Rhodocyclus TaxID=1064 RepID=A0A6L5JWG4_RHOTE|nr:TonB-dependent receptor [Rhodocyclus gracilis]MQY51416.1 TonB-dependent receptor [Rhodocyclus gracilis]NJA89264.1 TonB-dependent receptor [Rhodocyclus gracilis]
MQHNNSRRRTHGAPLCHLAPLAAALAACVPASAYASEGDTVVVTATRQETRSNELLSDVTVITREQIEQAGQTSVEQLLAQQPGVEYWANGGPGTLSAISIRGANSNHTLLLIDGQRVGSISSGAPDFSRLPLSQIERIEILRGPASSLYGADAIGGVIQIFTKRGEGPARINASTGYGTYGTSDSNVGIAGGTDVVSYSLQAGYYETNGFSAIRNSANPSYNADHDGFYRSSFSGGVSVRPATGHEIGLNFLSSNGTNKYDNGPGTDDANRSNTGSVSLYSRNRFTDDWTSTLRVGHGLDDATTLTNGIASGLYRTQQDQASWQNDIRLPVGKALLAAEYLKQNLTSSSTYTLTERTIKSLLAGWSGNLGDHRLQANLRHDDNSQFGGKTTGTAAYGYQFTADWRAHISYGTAFKAPAFNNLYFPLTCYPGWGCYGGNPNLKPETARNAEAGINWEKSGHSFAATYFRNKVSDLIDASLPVPINVNKASLSGTSLAYSGNFGDFSGGVSLDLQRARDDTTGKQLARRADEQLKTHLAWTSGALKFGGEWQLSGKRYDDAANTKKLGGYGLVNLFAERRIDSEWTLFARANNVFNREYELARDYATPGASLFVGVRYQQK